MNKPLHSNSLGVGLPGPSGRYGFGPANQGQKPQQSQAAEPPKQPDAGHAPKQSS